jgi:hypothetical protein
MTKIDLNDGEADAIIDALQFRAVALDRETGHLPTQYLRRTRATNLRVLVTKIRLLTRRYGAVETVENSQSIAERLWQAETLNLAASRRVRSTGIQYELAPTELLEVLDAL